MRRQAIFVVAGIILVFALSLYQFFWYIIAAGSFCTGTGSSQYYDTLACSGGTAILITFGAMFLNAVMLFGLIFLWLSHRIATIIKAGLSMICVVYVVLVVTFPVQFWMIRPDQ